MRLPREQRPDEPSGEPRRDTFPRLILHHARERPRHPAIREKDLGIWQTWTWAEVAAQVRAFACGLAARGFSRGDRIAIIGDNRPRLYWAMAAAQCLGGVPVPLYQDSVAGEMVYPLVEAAVRLAVVEDQEQVDKLLEIRARCPDLAGVVYDDPRGLRDYDPSFLAGYDELQLLGRAWDRAHPGFFDAQVAAGAGSDVAIILYTSGTTGRPKGVMLTHDNLVITGRNGIDREGLTAEDEVLAYLPMAWVGDNLFSYAQSCVAGFCVSCPESGETVLADLREIGPTYNFAPPRVYENMLTSVLIRMEDASAWKRRMFDFFMRVARRAGADLLDGKPVSARDRALYGIGRALVYGPLKNVLGLSRIRLAYTAGEAIGPDLFGFFRSLGINIKQLYGSTEGSVFVCVQPDGGVKPDTVGTPVKDVEVKIAEDGEVLFRGPGVFHSYFKNPQATAEARTPDGWVHTGDAGFFDEDGHLKIIDRARDVGKLRNGTLFAPKYLENKLKYFPWIREAVAFGDARDHAAAFVNIDLQAVGDWAERRNLPYSGYTDLAAQEPVSELVRECVEKVNRDLSADSRLSGSQIRRFLILHKELDADDGELTRTRKVRRSFVAERYAELVEALYSGQDTCRVDATVRYEDGREGRIRADVRIREAAVYEGGPPAGGGREGRRDRT
ncbi:MAG: AMP-binding protein [Acidobacteria bacterium]|nr:AMP-binding protein [Acidobacteriota bacterium]MCA1611813.1 AMP-binding protein [Acidobacteriota bacterium]